MAKQVWCRQFTITISSTQNSFSPCGAPSLDTDAKTGTPAPAAGTIADLFVAIDVLPAAGTTKVFTLAINGTPTAMAVTLDDAHTSGQYSGAAITVAAGDLVSIIYTKTGTPGASAAATISWMWSGTKSVYMGSNFALNTTTPRWIGCFSPSETSSTVAANIVHNVVAAAGNITDLYATLAAAAGTTGSYTFTIYKNGVAQDGSGGTPDTRVSLTNAVTRVSGNASFTLPVVAGDTVYIQVDSVSSPSTKTGAVGIAFQSTTGGESQMCWSLASITGTGGGVNSYSGPHLANLSWNTVGNRKSTVCDKFKLYGLRMVLATAPGGVTSRTFVNVQNDIAGTVTCTITGVATTGSDTTHTDSYAAADTICFLESAVSGSPAASIGTVGFIQFVQGGNPPGKSQGGNKKNGGGAVNSLQPGGTICMTIGNAGNSSEVQ